MRLEADCGCKKSGLSGLGWWQELLTTALSPGGNQPGNTAAQPPTITTVTTTTNVNPNISPQFVQQQSPNNSPVGLTAPSSGFMPGFDTYSGSMPGFPNVSVPHIQTNYMTLGIAAMALLSVGLVYKLSRGNKKARR